MTILFRLFFAAANALALLLTLTVAADGAVSIRFHTQRPGFVSLNIHRPDGSIVRQLIASARLAAGDHEIPWDGLADGAPLPPGDYDWSAVIHDGLGLQLRGWVGDWGGDRGVPSAAAADDAGVYLGWSLATANADTVVACSPHGVVRWTHHRGPLSGCRALAADGDVVFVLGGEGSDANGGSLYKLNAKTGAPIPWPNGRIDLKITSLWPADAKNTPVRADYLAVKNGRIYLSFTVGEFVSVLDARSGAYLQTVVGAPPGAVDSVATKSDTPENPGELVDADFLVMALKGGALGKMLLIHDPIWVVASDLTPLGRDENISALAMIGDGAKHHMHDIFIGLGSPTNQVQARSALESENFTYVAGEAGIRPPLGPWQPDRMADIRAVALDAAGQLWVAEGDAVPKRISVWTTDTSVGHLAREFFAPPGSDSPVAVHPRDPMLMVAGGCEWRIDSKTGRAACLGVIFRDSTRSARFAMENERILLLLTLPDGNERLLERIGDGDYQPYSGPAPKTISPKLQLIASPDGSWRLTTTDGYALGSIFQSINAESRAPIVPPIGKDWPPLPDAVGTPRLTQMLNGKIVLTAGSTRVWNFELTGMETLRPLASGKITLP